MSANAPHFPRTTYHALYLDSDPISSSGSPQPLHAMQWIMDFSTTTALYAIDHQL